MLDTTSQSGGPSWDQGPPGRWVPLPDAATVAGASSSSCARWELAVAANRAQSVRPLVAGVGLVPGEAPLHRATEYATARIPSAARVHTAEYRSTACPAQGLNGRLGQSVPQGSTAGIRGRGGV